MTRAQVCTGGAAAQEEGAGAARQRRKGWQSDAGGLACSAGHMGEGDAPGGGARVQAARAACTGRA
jgi:hypothetical protein